MSENKDNGFLDQLGRSIAGIFKFLIRFLFVLALAIGLGAGIYYGISLGLPALDRIYIQPVRENTNDIASIEARGTQMVEQFSTQIAGLQERLTGLEVQSDTNKEALAGIDSRLSTMEPSRTGQEDLALRIDELAALLTALEESVTADLDAQDSAMVNLITDIEANQNTVEALRERLDREEFPADQVYLELQLVKAMSLLTRSQVFTFQNNYGLAIQDIETARELLVGLRVTAAAELSFDDILTRLDLALANLPDRPDQAEGDLEIAWGLLVDGLATPSPEPEADEPSTPSSESTPQATGTLVPTPTP